MAMAYRSGSGDAQRITTSPFSGMCRPEGNAYIAKWDGAGETAIELRADSLMLNNAGMLFAYKRR